MSAEYQGQDPIAIAKQAERDLNSDQAKNEHRADTNNTRKNAGGASDSSMSHPKNPATLALPPPHLTQEGRLNRFHAATESGVDQSVENKFPGAQVTYGSAASGAGNNREIPLSEGGDVNPSTGR